MGELRYLWWGRGTHRKEGGKGKKVWAWRSNKNWEGKYLGEVLEDNPVSEICLCPLWSLLSAVIRVVSSSSWGIEGGPYNKASPGCLASSQRRKQVVFSFSALPNCLWLSHHFDKMASCVGEGE